MAEEQARPVSQSLIASMPSRLSSSRSPHTSPGSPHVHPPTRTQWQTRSSAPKLRRAYPSGRLAADRAARSWSRSGPELVRGVLVDLGVPELRYLAVAHMEDVRRLPLVAATVPGGGLLDQRDAVLVVGQQIVHLDFRGPIAEFHEFAEEAEDLLLALVVAGDRAMPSDVPDDIVVKSSLIVSMSPAP